MSKEMLQAEELVKHDLQRLMPANERNSAARLDLLSLALHKRVQFCRPFALQGLVQCSRLPPLCGLVDNNNYGIVPHDLKRTREPGSR
jgi:hypothetical protein